MWCWGESPANGQSNNTNVPAEVGGGHTFVAVNAGSGFTCGQDALGDVWCFGAYGRSCWVLRTPGMAGAWCSAAAAAAAAAVAAAARRDAGLDH